MYFIAFMIVVVLSAAVSLRRTMKLSRDSRGGTPAQRLAARRRALWPAVCAGVCTLGLLGIYHVQARLEADPSVTLDLTAFTAAVFGGWFLGVIGGSDLE